MEKIFCGDGKSFGQFESVKLNICLSDIPPEYRQKAKNGKTYATLVLSRKKGPDQYGKTHYIEVDTWKQTGEPKKQNFSNPLDETMEFNQDHGNHDDMPF